MSAHVLLNLFNSCEKEIKCSAILAFYFFSKTSLINLIKHEHSRKILYIIFQKNRGGKNTIEIVFMYDVYWCSLTPEHLSIVNLKFIQSIIN